MNVESKKLSTHRSSKAENPNLSPVFSVLPFGLKAEFDVEGWQTEIAENARAEIIILQDEQVNSEVVELTCDTFYRAAISFPDETKIIGSPYPFLSVHLKNLDRYMAIEVEIEDREGVVRTIRASNAQSLVRQTAEIATIPLTLVPGWNSVILDLQTLTSRLFNTHYKHAVRVRIFSSCRVRRAYFHSRIMQEHELPEQVRIFPEVDFDVRPLLQRKKK